jgi:hypothetical protein
MRNTKETFYVLLVKDLETERMWVEGVYGTREFAEQVMEEEMTLWEERRSYKIEEDHVD